jgi:polyisoprenyl-teichoic acid--peptidoglycan teichoic acid transferase
VLQGVFNQLISMNGISRAPELYDIYVQNVTTNLSFGDIAGLIPLAAHLADTGELGRYSIGTGQVYSWTNTSGAMVLVPVRDAVLDVMRQALNSP